MRLLSMPIFVCTLALVAAPPALARPDTTGRRVDVNGSIVAGGDPVTVTIPSDENALITFTGTANQRVSLALSGVSIWMGWVSIRKPDGSDLVWPTVFFTGGKFIDTVTLPTTGTYTIFVDPYSSYSGSVTLALFSVPADAGGPITAGGDAASATIGTPGQNARFTFSGTQGQRVSVKATGSNMRAQGAYVSLLKPDGSPLASSYPNLVTNNAARFSRHGNASEYGHVRSASRLRRRVDRDRDRDPVRRARGHQRLDHAVTRRNVDDGESCDPRTGRALHVLRHRRTASEPDVDRLRPPTHG